MVSAAGQLTQGQFSKHRLWWNKCSCPAQRQLEVACVSSPKNLRREAKRRNLGWRVSTFTRRMSAWGTRPRSTWDWKAAVLLGGARARVENCRRWKGRDRAAWGKGQVWECLLKGTCWGEPSPHTSGIWIWELAVCIRKPCQTSSAISTP